MKKKSVRIKNSLKKMLKIKNSSEASSSVANLIKRPEYTHVAAPNGTV